MINKVTLWRVFEERMRISIFWQHHLRNICRYLGIQDLFWGKNCPTWQCQALGWGRGPCHTRHWNSSNIQNKSTEGWWRVDSRPPEVQGDHCLYPNLDTQWQLIMWTDGCNQDPVSQQLKVAMKPFAVKDGILYKNNYIKVPNNNMIETQILNSQQNSKLAGHPRQAKTLFLVKHSFVWQSMAV